MSTNTDKLHIKRKQGYYDKLLDERSKLFGYSSWHYAKISQRLEVIDRIVKSALFYESWEQTLNLQVENDELKKEIARLQKYLQ